MTFNFQKMLAGVLATTSLVGPLAAAEGPVYSPLFAPPPSFAPASTFTPTPAASSGFVWGRVTRRAIGPVRDALVPPAVLLTNPNAAEQCGPLKGRAPDPAIEARIKDFTSLLSQSATGRDLLQAAVEYESNRSAWIVFEKLVNEHALYYAGRGVLVVNAEKSNHEIIGDAVHELRHLFHEKTGLYELHADKPNDQLHIKYVSEADAEATAALALWELKQAGHSAPWDKQNDHDTYNHKRVCYAHITTSFKNAVESGMTPALASAQAFRSWYRDQKLLSFYRDGVMENVTAHPCTQPDQARLTRQFEMPSDQIMEQILPRVAQLPAYNINYLQQAGGMKAVLQSP